MMIRFHLPWWFRRPDEAPNHPCLPFYYGIFDEFSKRPEIEVLSNDKVIWPKHIAPDVYALNHHKLFKHPRNLNLKMGYLPDFMYFDRFGYSGWSELSQAEFIPEDIDLRVASDYFKRVVFQKFIAKGISKYPQNFRRTKLPEGYIFVPLQVPGDRVLGLAYLTQQEIVDTLRGWGRAPIVIKIHPYSYTKFPEHAQYIQGLHDPKSGVYVVNDHIHYLIHMSKAVVCTNSGSGFEALMLGKPVIACGKSDYHHIARTALSKEDLISALESIERLPDDIRMTYIYWHCRQMLYVHDDPKIWVDRILAKFSGH